MTVAVQVESLGKEYKLGDRAHMNRVTESLSRALAAPGRALRRRSSEPEAPAGTVWALRDVSFQIEQGEVVGFVGRNGAGKSTLLKVLSRITDPTEGWALLDGRVGSLLEVGTGFHLELTGRENVFMSGAILGMRRAEILRKFDEIVEFAEIGRHLDTPVKRYSSGMQVRLGFAVAAHLETEILIVDEVLSVGDAAFQRKCLGKIEDVAHGGGRTILFVSHNMQAVKALCDRAIYLEEGRVKLIGDSDAVVRSYLDYTSAAAPERTWDDPARRPGNEQLRLVAVRVLDPAGAVASVISSSSSFVVELELDVAHPHSALTVGFDLQTDDGNVVLSSFHTDAPAGVRPELHVGRNVVRSTVPGAFLNAGGYAVSPRVALHGVGPILHEDAAVRFEVLFDHGGDEFFDASRRPGTVAPLLGWST